VLTHGARQLGKAVVEEKWDQSRLLVEIKDIAQEVKRNNHTTLKSLKAIEKAMNNKMNILLNEYYARPIYTEKEVHESQSNQPSRNK